MASITADRVLETSSTVGSGPYTLNGAVAGFRAVSAVAVSSDTFYYFAEGISSNGAPSGDWEVGLGTLNADGTVSRTAVDSSSHSDLPVAWAAGTRRFGIGMSAAQIMNFTLSAINAATRLIQTQKIMAQLASRGQV